MNKAWLLRTDGSKRRVEPMNGTDFTLEEVQRLLDVDMVEKKDCPENMIMLMDEEGKQAQSVVNYQATLIVVDLLLPGDCIVGDVLYCENGMFK